MTPPWTETPPRFSVVVPAFNEAVLLPATLESLCRQRTAADFEVIVVDNNSTDDTAEIARSYGVRVVAEAEPGVCQARQTGTVAARGEIIVSADADTTYPGDWLARIDAAFARHADVVAVAGPCRYADPPWWMDLFAHGLFEAVDWLYRASGWVGYVTATNIAFRRSGFDGYDLRLTQGGDELELLRRLRQRGRVLWDRDNVVETSARRQRRGLLHTLVVTLVIHYLLGYVLNKLFGRPVLGTAPPVRDAEAQPTRLTRGLTDILTGTPTGTPTGTLTESLTDGSSRCA